MENKKEHLKLYEKPKKASRKNVKKTLLKGLLKKESKIVRRSSIKVLREMEKINDDID